MPDQYDQVQRQKETQQFSGLYYGFGSNCKVVVAPGKMLVDYCPCGVELAGAPAEPLNPATCNALMAA